MADRDDVYDYPPEDWPTPTSEELEYLGQLADKLFTETDERVLKNLMEHVIPDLLIDTDLPRADFRAPCGRWVRVKTTFRGSRALPGKEAEAKRWLDGRTMKSAFMECLRRGQALPSSIFDVVIRTTVRPDKKV